MTGRGVRDGGDAPASGRPRSGPASVADAQQAANREAQAGRPGGGAETSATGRTGAAPDGLPARIGRGEDDEVRRSLEMENSGATSLAAHGFRVRQNPTSAEVARARLDTGDTGDPASRPDYLIEGRVFDCYSPTNPAKKPRGIWTEVEQKVAEGQTQRVVVNLQDWRGDESALRRQFLDWPIAGLKELKVITPDGDIVQMPLSDGDPH